MSMMEGENGARSAMGNICFVYAIIKEAAAGGQSETVCGGVAREHHAFLSVSNSVEVRLIIKRDDTQFMLKYQGECDIYIHIYIFLMNSSVHYF